VTGPIGVFDSGVGGLTVYRAIHEELPSEDLVYLGDTARLPYGTKSRETVVRYSMKNVEFLLSHGIKLLVVACNTASALALDEIRQAVDVPVVGVVEPGAEAAAAASRGGEVLVIGTESTVRSGAYEKAILERRPTLRVLQKACPLFVPLAEEGWVDNVVAREAARIYLEPFRGRGVDTLVLGCTHYPLLRNVIAEAIGPGVVLVDSAREAARSVRAALASALRIRQSDWGPGEKHFFVTDASERFRSVAETFLGGPIERLERVDIV
jgi:glutamate racemase